MATVADVDVCTTADIGIELTGSGAPPLIAALDAYLSVFAKPVERDGVSGFMFGKYECLKCGAVLDGALGAFRWGIANGEGTCGRCGWPARAHHYPEDADGAIFDRPLEIILQYHPGQVTAEAADGELLAETEKGK